MSIEKVFILHHTHVDFGYTDLRSRIEPKLVSMVGEALDVCLRSAARPEPERFRWIHEASWPLLRCLAQGTRKRKALLDSIRGGRTELTAMYLNPTDLFDRDTFEESIGYAVQLAREESLPLDTAMFCDAPGIAWSIPDILHERGVRYLSTAPNVIMSCPLEVERPFYWEGPKGGRVLTWFTDWRYCWYAEGLWYLKLAEDPETACRKLQDYVAQLESEGYRWKGLAINVAMDNEPPRPELMDTVARWNKTHSAVELRMATNHDFFAYMEQQHARQFAVHRGVWADWWANGNGSAACETAYSRKAKVSLRRSAALAGRLKCEADDSYRTARRAAMENVLLFDEHTWGDSKSVVAPWTPTSRLEWDVKRDYAYRGMIEAAALEQSLVTRLDSEAEVVLFNPHAESVTAPVALRSAAGATAPALIEKKSGKRIEGQRAVAGLDGRSPRGLVHGHDSRPLASSILEGEACAPGAETENSFVAQALACGRISRRNSPRINPAPQSKTAAGWLENDNYKIACDPRGRVRTVHDKQLGRLLVSGSPEWSFGELVHERVPGTLGRRAFYEPSLAQTKDGLASQGAKLSPRRLVRKGGDAHSRSAGIVAGPVFMSLVSGGELPGVRFEREIRLYQGIRRMDVFFRLHKQAQAEYESLYVDFPFAIKPCEIWIENAGAIYRAGKDQLPGSATDWLSVGEYLAVAGNDCTALLVPHHSPLVQVGAINSGKWQPRLTVAHGHIYSWIMNNMWGTNFPAHQEGVVELAWSLTSHAGKFSEAKARPASPAASRTGIAVRDAAGEADVPKDWLGG